VSDHLCAYNQSADHTAPDDDRLQHVEAVEGGNEGVLHFLVVPDGLLKVAPLQLLIAEVLHSFVVQQCICCLGALGIVQPVQIPAAAPVVLSVLARHPINACKYVRATPDCYAQTWGLWTTMCCAPQQHERMTAVLQAKLPMFVCTKAVQTLYFHHLSICLAFDHVAKQQAVPSAAR